MLILALDTTTRVGSAALLRDDELLLEEGSDPERPPAARLPADLIALVEHAGVALGDIDVLAVATGPGSFTGLRIGIATMQGLAFAMRKPLIGVSALDALARVAAGPAAVGDDQTTPVIVTWVDAWRGEVYAAVYGAASDLRDPVVANPEALLDDYVARAGDGQREPVVFIGDGADAYRDLITGRLGAGAVVAHPAVPLLAEAIARTAREGALRGDLPPPHAIRPLYVRRPDAELARSRR